MSEQTKQKQNKEIAAKAIAIIALIIALLAGGTGLYGLIRSGKGANGVDGLSAYQLAVENGYSGTLQEWLNELNGVDGKDGSSAYELAVKNGFTGTEAQWLESLKAKNGEDGLGVKSAVVNSDGNLIITLSNNSKINVGKVVGSTGAAGEKGTDGIDGKDGTDGVGVTAFTVDENGNATITFSDGSSTNLGKIVGADGKDGADGVGVASAALNDNGELVLTFTNGQQFIVGSVIGAKGEKGDKGDTGSNGTGIASVEINDAGELVLILTDDTSINVGKIVGKDGADGTNGSNGADGVGIRSVAIVNDELIVTLTDDTETNLGNVKGAKGDKGDPGEKGADGTNGLDGKGITDTSINADGYLIITYTDGSTQNAGKVISSGSSDTNDYALGSIITMGTYEQDNDTSNGAEPIEWIVVQNTGDKVLLLSRDVLTYLPFAADNYRDSQVREFLIGSFYENSFTDAEKARILESHIYGMNFTDKVGTTNKVFILSYDEITALLLNNIDLTPGFSQSVIAIGAREDDLVWLRSAIESRTESASYCCYNVYKGELIIGSPYTLVAQGGHRDTSCGVRPSMWISIEE